MPSAKEVLSLTELASQWKRRNTRTWRGVPQKCRWIAVRKTLMKVAVGGDYSPRPVRIIFHPSLRRLSTSAFVIAVMPQATL